MTARIILLIGIVVLTSCQMPASIESSPTNEGLQHESTPAQTQQAENSNNKIHAVYYLSGDLQNPQIWRTTLDNATSQQVTGTDSPGISDFDINTFQDTLSLIFEQNLYILPLENAGNLIDEYQVKLPGDSRFPLQTPRWSPDGTSLAIGFGGIRIYQPQTMNWTLLLPDKPDGTSYFPYAWSPDGSALLVSIRQADAATLGVLTISTGTLDTLQKQPICCQASWTPDSKSIMVSNPIWGIYPTGLRLIDRISGEEKWLIPPQSSDGTYNLVGWPHLNPEGTFSFFYGNFPSPPETLPLLSLVSTHLPADQPPNTSSFNLLRTDSLMINEVLWADDGSQAVIVQPPPGMMESSKAGPVILIPAGESPAIPFSASGYNLRWGP